MKKLFLILAIFSVSVFGQTYSKIDSVTASDTTYHYIANPYEFAILTITLPSANDTVVVQMGTNLEDFTASHQEYGQTVITDLYDGSEVPEITGNTIANRKYFLKWAYRQKNIRLISKSNSATVHYVLEAY